MTKKKIEREYNKKIKKLVELNKFYYDQNNPIVDDRVYDALKKEILELESKHSYLKNEKSPSFVIKNLPSLVHLQQMDYHLR